MKRLLVAIVLVGLIVNPALHWCCMAVPAATGMSAMASCHAVHDDARARLAVADACRHGWPAAVASEVSARTDALVLDSTVPTFVSAPLPESSIRRFAAAPDVSPPTTTARPLRI